MNGGGGENRARLLIAVGAAALVAAVALRALTDALDLSPVVTFLVAWALLTVGFAVYVRRRGASDAAERDEGR